MCVSRRASKSVALRTHPPFLIGFCVCLCVFSCLLFHVWIYRRHDRPPLLLAWKIIQWRARRRRWPNVRPAWGPCKPFRSSIRPVYAASRPSIPIAMLSATPSSITRAWWPPKKVFSFLFFFPFNYVPIKNCAGRSSAEIIFFRVPCRLKIK